MAAQFALGATWLARARGTDSTEHGIRLNHGKSCACKIFQEHAFCTTETLFKYFPIIFSICKSALGSIRIEGFGSSSVRHGSLSRGPFCRAPSKPLSEHHASRHWRRESFCGEERLEATAGSPVFEKRTLCPRLVFIVRLFPPTVLHRTLILTVPILVLTPGCQQQDDFSLLYRGPRDLADSLIKLVDSMKILRYNYRLQWTIQLDTLRIAPGVAGYGDWAVMMFRVAER